MTFEQMLELTEFPVSEGEFRSTPAPPYIVWELDGDTICADGKVVYIEGIYDVYLAVSRGDSESEKTLEAVLDAHGIAYTKERSWIGGKQMIYLCEYQFDAKEDW